MLKKEDFEEITNKKDLILKIERFLSNTKEYPTLCATDYPMWCYLLDEFRGKYQKDLMDILVSIQKIERSKLSITKDLTRNLRYCLDSVFQSEVMEEKQKHETDVCCSDCD